MKSVVDKDTPARGKGKTQTPAKDRAKAITEALEGVWDDDAGEKGKGRYAQCLLCDAPEMSVTPYPQRIVVHCHRCGKAGQLRLFALSCKAFDLSGDPEPPRKHRRKDLPVADAGVLISLTPSQRRALLALAKLAKGGAWFEARQRWLTGECRVSGRDAIPLLMTLDDLKLIWVRRGNHSPPYRATQVRFLVDPVDIERRLAKAKAVTEAGRGMVSYMTPKWCHIGVEAAYVLTLGRKSLFQGGVRLTKGSPTQSLKERQSPMQGGDRPVASIPATRIASRGGVAFASGWASACRTEGNDWLGGGDHDGRFDGAAEAWVQGRAGREPWVR